MVAYHHHPEEYRAYISRLRERSEGWKRFFDKWGLEQHIEFGLGVRTLDDLATVVGETDARARFFFNGDLSLRRTRPLPAALLIGDFEKIATVGALDGKGNRAANEATSGSLLLDPDSFAIIPAPEANIAARPAAAGAAPNDDDARQRYRLETSDCDQAVSAADQEIYFRYDAILRRDSDFYLWYYRSGAMTRHNPTGRRLAAVVRWLDCDRRILVWKSRRTFVNLRPTGYWRPLHVDVLLLPHGVTWLRFDLITDGGPSPDPLCTGFLFAGRATDLPHPDSSAFEVLGLSRLPNDVVIPGENGRYLEDIGRTCPERLVTLRRSSFVSDMMLFETDEVPGLEALYFVGWNGLGRALVGARLPKRAPNPPVILALPSTEWCSPSWRIYGYGGAVGFNQTRRRNGCIRRSMNWLFIHQNFRPISPCCASLG
jgi:hypothetical protein